MAKFLKNSAGALAEEATVGTSAGAGDSGKLPHLNGSGVLDLTITNGKNTSAGAGDAGKLAALDSTGKLDTTMMPTGIGADTDSIQASEALAAGDWVNIHNSSGSRIRKADATTAGKEAHGFVLSAVSSGANGTVFFEGGNTQVTGKTPGAMQFLSTTPGLSTETAPSATGNIVQRIGVARSATKVDAAIQQPITLV